MKIKNIKINSYGNLKQKEINLENSINIIYGKNESGKSTLLNYIKNIFYGISKNKNGKEISDYEKYLPWIGEEFSGKIKYELNNKKIYEIFRNFKKKNANIFNENSEEISNEFQINKKDGSQFFYEQTGIDEKTFCSTIMSAQQEVVLDNQSQNILIQKLANLAGTGDDNVSFKKAIDKLNKKQVEEVGTNRTQDRPLNILQDEIKKIEFDLKLDYEIKNKKENLEIRKQILEEKLEKENQKNNILNELNLLFNKFKIELEKNNLKNKIKNEDEEKLKKLIEEKNNLIKNNSKNINFNSEKNNKSKNKLNYLIIIFILLIILNIFNFILINNKIINYIILSLIPINIILLIINLIKNKKTKNKLKKEEILNEQLNKEFEEKNIAINSQINLLKEKVNKAQEEINNEKNNIIFEFNSEKERINNINFNIDEKENAEKELEISNNKIMEYQLELNNIKYEENSINEKLEKLIYNEEKYKYLKEQLSILEEKNICIQAAKEILEKSYEKMKNNVTPKFTENLSNIVKNISNGKYKKVIFNEEKGLIVELENGEYISANRLSIGTIDQLYLSLRLSMINEISEEKMPIILDEAFAYFDEERLKNCLLYLIGQSEEHQIIILTCSNREKNILDEFNIKYNLVEL